MNTQEFLSLVWPDAGHGFYCLATPFTPPGAAKPVFAHRVVSTITEAVKFAEQQKNQKNIFFCVHTLIEEKRWNKRKKDPRTGEMGAYEVRTQSNTQASKVFFFDIDVGAEDEKKYASQREALIGLKEFCKASGLPQPLIVSSGGGLHTYWIMDEVVSVERWRPIAAKLKKIAQVLGLKIDPMRTTDSASVLRVVGTFNLKTDTKRPVQAYTPARTMSVVEFEAILDAAAIRTGTVVPAPASVPAAYDPDFNNLDKVYDGPPVTIKELLTGCPQIFRVAKLGGNVSEPEWYAALSAVRLVEGGDKYIHKISDKHPDYTKEATEAKVQRLIDNKIGPTGCDKWHDINPSICEGCQFYQKIRSPMTAARRNPEEVQPPTLSYSIGNDVSVEIIPPAPEGYLLSKYGIQVKKTDANGDNVILTIYDHHLYPLRRIANRTSQTEEQVWRAELPRNDQPHDFILPADALYDSRKLNGLLAHNGVYPSPENTKELQNYMVAYIAKLQKLNDAEDQANHLGWADDHTKFILPDKILYPGGVSKRVTLSKHAQRSSQFMTKRGSMEKQIELMNFYNHPAFIPHQFFIMCSLAAPIFYMTGHHGVVVNASGETGAGKSSALYTGASFWGQTELYAINGTDNGATMKFRNERLSTLANLPVCVDEITDIEAKEASGMVMSVTQPGGRGRLEKDGSEKAAPDSYKATVMMTTANTSLHNILSSRNTSGTAGSMRVFEIVMSKNKVYTKPQADDYMHELRQHCGYIGEVFMRFVVDNREAIHNRVRAIMKRIDVNASVQSGERFWSGIAAAALVAGDIAKRLKLLPYDVRPIEQWLYTQQLPFSRGVVRDEYISPINVLANYLESINDQILVVQHMQHTKAGMMAIVAKMPRGGLLARLEQDVQVMFVARQGLKDYCVKHGLSERTVIDALHQPIMCPDGKERRIVTQKLLRKVLGMGTDLSKIQSNVLTVDMSHPEVAGNKSIQRSTAT